MELRYVKCPSRNIGASGKDSWCLQDKFRLIVLVTKSEVKIIFFLNDIQQAKQSKPVAVTSLAFPTGDVNNFVVGSEDGAVYTACRYEKCLRNLSARFAILEIHFSLYNYSSLFSEILQARIESWCARYIWRTWCSYNRRFSTLRPRNTRFQPSIFNCFYGLDS